MLSEGFLRLGRVILKSYSDKLSRSSMQSPSESEDPSALELVKPTAGVMDEIVVGTKDDELICYVREKSLCSMLFSRSVSYSIIYVI